MLKQDLKLIVKPYYDALEEGRILGRKCTKCGHVEYPPYLMCNKCGCLDTEWYEISGKAVATQIMPAAPAFIIPPVAERFGGEYAIASITLEEGIEVGGTIINMPQKRVEEMRSKVPVAVRPVILQEDGFKVAVWEIDE